MSTDPLAPQPTPAPDVAAIGARAAAATPGPWEYVDDGDTYVIGDATCEAARVDHGQGAEADAAFIAHARADVPALLATLAREREGHAAEVAAAVDDAVRRERDMWQAQIETTTTDAADALDMIDDLVRHAVLHHPLPWRIEDDWTREVTAKDGTIIAKCMTHARAAAIIATAEKIRAELDAPMCDTCGKPATCGGSYEHERAYACDDCCGHGGEDGHCEPVGDAPAQGVG